MMRVVLMMVAVLLVVALTWVAIISSDIVVPFAQLDLRTLRMDARALPTAPGGRVLISFGWAGPSTGRCIRVRSDVHVAVGGDPARALRLGGGQWILGAPFPLPRHVCRNDALYEVERELKAGVVAASLGDGRGRPALIAGRDLMVPPSLALESPQPARAGERAVVAVLPDEHALAMWPAVERGGDTVWPVELDAHRAVFTVPPRWRAGPGDLRVRADRTAVALRCERAKQCAVYALPIDASLPFVVAAP